MTNEIEGIKQIEYGIHENKIKGNKTFLFVYQFLTFLDFQIFDFSKISKFKKKSEKSIFSKNLEKNLRKK